jgi:hypothetical protein
MSPELAVPAEDPRSAKIRRFSADRISAALVATEGRRDIERLMAIGHRCPYAGLRECLAIWLEEFHRLWSERSGSRQAERAAWSS